MRLDRTEQVSETIEVIAEDFEVRFTTWGARVVVVYRSPLSSVLIFIETDEEADRLIAACEAKRPLLFTGIRKTTVTAKATYTRFDAVAWMEAGNAHPSGM